MPIDSAPHPLQSLASNRPAGVLERIPRPAPLRPAEPNPPQPGTSMEEEPRERVDRARTLAVPRAQKFCLGLLGAGRVGGALLRQLAARQEPLLRRGLDLELRAIAGRHRMVLAEEPLEPRAAWPPARSSEPTDLRRLAAHLVSAQGDQTVLVDLTASDEVADLYPEWLHRGLHVVTANKHGSSGPLRRYRSIREAALQGGLFFHETTVGAGLPVLGTLSGMLAAGDELLEFEGALSGTLSWLLTRFDGSRPFAELVREARELGITEPDPRVDLSGIDVARKLVILAREAGHDLELSGVERESLLPDSLACLEQESFLRRLEELDEPMDARRREAEAIGARLGYLARLSGTGAARVGLVPLPPEHPGFQTQGTDNWLRFRTRYYSAQPLVLQGPGAGPEVTAAGVLGDLLSLARRSGVRV